MRKRCVRKHYHAVNPVALAIERVSPAEVTAIVANMWTAFESLQFGRAQRQDWDVLAKANNHGLVFSRDQGVGPEHQDLFEACHDHLLSIAARYRRTGKLGANAQELNALREMCQVHDLQLQSVTTAELIDCATRVDRLVRVHKTNAAKAA